LGSVVAVSGWQAANEVEFRESSADGGRLPAEGGGGKYTAGPDRGAEIEWGTGTGDLAKGWLTANNHPARQEHGLTTSHQIGRTGRSSSPDRFRNGVG